MQLITDTFTTIIGIYLLAAFIMLVIDNIAHLLRAGVDRIDVRM